MRLIICLSILYVALARGNACEIETDPEKLAYLSPVVVVAKTDKNLDSGSGLYTAVVKKTFQTKTGGLKKKKKISILAGTEECSFDLEKNTQYILFLNITEDKKVFINAFHPYKNPPKKQLKFIHKKILCKKCSIVAPGFKVKEKSLSATEGDKKYQILCKTKSGKPKPKMSWLFNGEPLSKDKAKKLNIKVSKPKFGTSTLTIAKVSTKHQGTYICNAENAAPDAASYLVILSIMPKTTTPARTTTPLTCNRCERSYCRNRGECCIDEYSTQFCVCDSGYGGERCTKRTLKTIEEAGPGEFNDQEQVIAVLGLCVALLISLLLCGAAYLFCLKPKSCTCHRVLRKPGMVEATRYNRTNPNTNHHPDSDPQRSLLSRTSPSGSHSEMHPCDTNHVQFNESANNSHSNNVSNQSPYGSDVSIEMKSMRQNKLPSRSSVTSNSGRQRLNGIAKDNAQLKQYQDRFNSEGNLVASSPAAPSAAAAPKSDQFSNPTYYPRSETPFAASVSHPVSLSAHGSTSNPPSYSSYSMSKYPSVSIQPSEVSGGSSIDLGRPYNYHPKSQGYAPASSSFTGSLPSSKVHDTSLHSATNEESSIKVSDSTPATFDVMKSDTEHDDLIGSLDNVKIPDMALNISPSVTRHNPPRTFSMPERDGLFYPSPTPAATVASAQRRQVPLLSASSQSKYSFSSKAEGDQSVPLSSNSSSEDLTVEGRSIEI